MRLTTFIIGLLFLLLVSCNTKTQESNDMKLWYTQAANHWEEALPLGNGRIGAMVYGGVQKDQIQLNEETVWAGEPGNNLPRGFKEVLPQIRELIFNGKYKEAEDLTMSVVPRHAPDWNNYGMPYQTVGDLFFEFDGHDQFENYHRELDIQNAVSTTTYSIEGVNYKREYLTSAPDQVLAIQFSADQEGKISFSIDATSPHTVFNKLVQNGELVFTGKSEKVENKEGKVRFHAIVKPVLEGGTIEVKNNKVLIKNANSVTVFVSIATNFKNYNDLSADEKQLTEQHLAKAVEKSYNTIKTNHIADYQNYFDRVNFDLGTTDSVMNPTNIRVRDFANANDPQLVSLYFQYGRYLLISSSRPGTQPANLQGIWNKELRPPWDSKYTVNINTEMNYWPAEVTNLSELHQPLFSMLKDLSETGKETASQMYGARGWMMHHNTDIWRMTGPIDGAFYGMWPMGGAWLSQHLWQHYLYNGDTEFLNEVYPILKGITLYYFDVLVQDPNTGYMVMAPCNSPENRHIHGTSMAAGNTMDNQLVFDVFSNFIETANILNTDAAFASEVQALKEQLPPMQVGQHNQLQEWYYDWDRKSDHHRHVSHLYGLYPSNQVSPFTHPELFEAAKNSLVYRGDKSTGWSMGWKVNLWARLLDGNRAYKLIADQLSPAPIETKGENGGTYPNLFDAHPPFQIDGNFGCTSGIAEMLMQSHDGAIQLLPALPDNWPSGEISGLKARGGFIVDLKWENHQLTHLKIESKLGGNLRIRVSNAIDNSNLNKAEGPNSNAFYKSSGIKTPLIKNDDFNAIVPTDYMEYDIATEQGQTLEIL